MCPVATEGSVKRPAVSGRSKYGARLVRCTTIEVAGQGPCTPRFAPLMAKGRGRERLLVRPYIHLPSEAGFPVWAAKEKASSRFCGRKRGDPGG